MMRRLLPWTLGLVVACEGGDDATLDTDSDPQDLAQRTCEGGTPRSFIVTDIRFVRATDNVSEGFDLDGSAESGDPSIGCGVEDQVGPDGQQGIDNSFSRLLPILELTEASAAEEVISENIKEGNILLMSRVTGLDDEVSDDCVTMEILQGLGAPLVGADGRLVAGQTFAQDVDGTYVSFDGTIEDGVAFGTGAALTIPISILNAQLNIGIVNAAMRMELDDDRGFVGMLAGGVDVEDLLEQVTSQGVNDEVLNLVRPVLAQATDLEPNAEGICTRMSVTLKVEAVEAFVYEVE